ncbi:MAG: PleD family two-component system response regulator [Proteobacteria bacterium]|nr:PleD family two-component system response regulator [Pseudomonadota bacterium]
MPAQVLVVDDILPNVKVLEAKLAAEYFDVSTAMSGAEALAKMRESPPDIVLLDVMMPEMDGFEVCRRIKADPRLAIIPVVMVTALSETSELVRGLEAGADDFLTKPVNDTALFALVRSLVRMKLTLDELRLREETSTRLGVLDTAADGGGVSGRPRILVVEDDPAQATAIVTALADRGEGEVETAGAAAMAAAAAGGFDVVVVSLTMKDFDGLRLCSHLRAQAATRDTAVLILIDPDGTAAMVRALEMGVVDYLVKPVDPAEVVARTRTQIRRKSYHDRLRARYEMSVAMAVTDSLTGLHNRRYLVGHLENLVARANAGGKPLSLMMLDIDHFKKVNDEHGHAAGDEVLQAFADRLRLGVRGIDLATRYGGEEFVVAMPDTSGAIAETVAGRLLKDIGGAPFPVLGGSIELPVTVSIGVTTSSGGDDSAEQMLARADEALYAAKEGGRNRMVARYRSDVGGQTGE